MKKTQYTKMVTQNILGATYFKIINYD